MKVYVHYEDEPDFTFIMQVSEDTRVDDVVASFSAAYSAAHNLVLQAPVLLDEE